MEAGCQNSLVSRDPKEIAKFFQGNCKTAGFTTQFAIDQSTKRVANIFKKGKLCQKDIKPLLDQGYTEWSYSWAWSPKTFKLPTGEIISKTGYISLVPFSKEPREPDQTLLLCS